MLIKDPLYHILPLLSRTFFLTHFFIDLQSIHMLEERLLNFIVETVMIRLEIKGETHIFDKNVVIIGNGEVDLHLDDPSLCLFI